MSAAFMGDIHHLQGSQWLKDLCQDAKQDCQNSCHTVQAPCEKFRRCVSSLLSSCCSCCWPLNHKFSREPSASSGSIQNVVDKALGALPESQQMK